MSKNYSATIMVKSNPTGGIYDSKLDTFSGTKKYEVMIKVKAKTDELDDKNTPYSVIETID